MNDSKLQPEDLPANDKIQTFKPEDLPICEKCGRKTPPTRGDCFYCGNPLPFAARRIQTPTPEFRKLEIWEKGFNVVVTKCRETPDFSAVNEIAEFLEFEGEDLRKILDSKKSLPLARVASNAEAKLIAEKLAAHNIESRIVADERLKPEISARRLRGIEFSGDNLIMILFNNDEIAEIFCKDLSLVVSGAIFERKIESIESIRRKEKGKVLNSNEIGSDQFVIDIYAQNDNIGYRIEQHGFDFSCLGNRKSLLAGENMKRLAEKLRAVLPQAEFDDDYLKNRAELGKIWEVQETISAGGVNRQSFGGFKRANTIIISNLTQFTRYSRLRREML